MGKYFSQYLTLISPKDSTCYVFSTTTLIITGLIITIILLLNSNKILYCVKNTQK